MKKLRFLLALFTLIIVGGNNNYVWGYNYEISFDLTNKTASDWSAISPHIPGSVRTYEVSINNTAGYLLVWGWQTGSQGVYTSSEYMAVRNLTQGAQVTLTLSDAAQKSNLTIAQNSDKITRIDNGDKIKLTVNDASVHMVELQATGEVTITNLALSLPIPAIYSYNLTGMGTNAWKAISPTVKTNGSSQEWRDTGIV